MPANRHFGGSPWLTVGWSEVVRCPVAGHSRAGSCPLVRTWGAEPPPHRLPSLLLFPRWRRRRFGRCRFLGRRHVRGGNDPLDHILLADRPDVSRDPVEDQAGGEG